MLRRAALVSRACARLADDISAMLDERQSEAPHLQVIGSFFLRDCFEFLDRQPEESIAFVTGPVTGGSRILDRLVTFELERQEVTFVSGRHEATHKALREIDHYGHKVHAWAHIHPGWGLEANCPSSIDVATQDRFERGGYGVIGFIFSRDGYVRFFTGKNPMDVEVYGERVEKVDEHVWRIALP